MENITVMLVDDELRFLTTTAKLLSRKGMEVVIAASGAEALEMLTAHSVQVAVLDVKMPGMDGVTLLKEIKSRFPVTEAIMLTGHASVDSAIDGLKSGAFDYLMKPCDIDLLTEKIKKAHEQWRTRERKINEAMLRRSMMTPRAILRGMESEPED